MTAGMTAADPAWIALSLVRQLGGKTLRALLAHFDGDLHAILAADEGALRAVPGIGPRLAAAIRAIDLDATVQRIERWQRAGVHLIPQNDPAYPPQLLGLEDAPPTLFALGDMKALHRPSAAVIGTRSPTAVALAAVEAVTALLVAADFTIVSGLARGIDHHAHINALAHIDGVTLAVLGGGVLKVYPPEHAALADAIIRRAGALVCEVAPDASVGAPSLVARNRIITGLCTHVIVAETASDGGAMHAARFARVQGRRLYAVDLPASGNRALIAQGATPLDPESPDRTVLL